MYCKRVKRESPQKGLSQQVSYSNVTLFQQSTFIMIQMLTTKLQTVKDFFTEEEWDAIDSALADYQDYGEKETDLMNSIGDKMQTLFAPRYQDENRHPESGAN